MVQFHFACLCLFVVQVHHSVWKECHVLSLWVCVLFTARPPLPLGLTAPSKRGRETRLPLLTSSMRYVKHHPFLLRDCYRETKPCRTSVDTSVLRTAWNVFKLLGGAEVFICLRDTLRKKLTRKKKGEVSWTSIWTTHCLLLRLWLCVFRPFEIPAHRKTQFNCCLLEDRQRGDSFNWWFEPFNGS